MLNTTLLAALSLLSQPVHPPVSAMKATSATKASSGSAHAASQQVSRALGSSVANPRPQFAQGYRPLDRDEFATLKSGVAAASIVVDLPMYGCVTIHVTKARLVSDDFEFETARVVKGRTVSSDAALVLPNAYEGRIEGVTDGAVYLGFGTEGAHGLVAGRITIGHDTWWLSSGSDAARRAGLPAMIAHETALAGQPLDGLTCMTASLKDGGAIGPPPAEGGIAGGESCREFRIAVDTDTEFTMTAHAGNTVAAGQYALIIMGAASQVYNNDIDARLPVSYLRLWTDTDPWNQTDMGAQLGEYRDYWQANMSAVSRDIGHNLNGRGLGGGVAWVGVACMWQDWAYGLSSGIGYGFPYPLVDHDHGNWEPFVVTHEIGHAFGAPHSHDHTPPADGCGLGDCSGAWDGTIMSYCHGCAGGMSNISLRFHEYSINSMYAHIWQTTCYDMGAHAADDAVSTIQDSPALASPLDNDAFVNCSAVTLVSFDTVSVHDGAITDLGGASPQLRYMPAPHFSGVDSFTYTIMDDFGATSTATVYVTVAPIHDQLFLLNPQMGVTASWFAFATEPLLLPDFSTLSSYGGDVLANIEIASTDGNFSTSGRSDWVGAAFDGFVRVPTTGVWTFSNESDDGSNLSIDGQLVLMNDGLHGMWDRSGQIALEAGYHRIRVEFFENGGGAGDIARWEGPGVAREVIPASAFRQNGFTMEIDLDGDGSVAAADLALLLAQWGPVATGEPADFDRNGSVGASDLSLLLSLWGQ